MPTHGSVSRSRSVALIAPHDYFAEGSRTAEIDSVRTAVLLERLVQALGGAERVLLLPPDLSRYHSGAGDICVMLYRRLTEAGVRVELLPAVGTHRPMTAGELDRMFPGVPHDRFHVHDWRNGVEALGVIPEDFVEEVSDGLFRAQIRVELDRLIVSGGWDAIVSVGQLVPHEVAGIANHNKNVLVGCGGRDFINKSHFLGAVFGMERIMGRAKTPVRDVFNEAERRFLGGLPLHYVLTVRERVADGRVVTRGLFAGKGDGCFLRGAELCRAANLNLLDRDVRKAVVYLDPEEFKSTWIGNKAIYRTRMAMAEGGELVILAPGVREFGEDEGIDALIRRFGYRGTPATLDAVASDHALASNLSAAAHLIHGSSEGRFNIRYCPGQLTRDEIVGAGFDYGDLPTETARYRPDRLTDGWNVVDGEEIYFVSNPGLGLWGTPERFGSG